MTQNAPSPEDNARAPDRPRDLIKPQRQSFLGSIWSSFLAGIVVVAPIGITVAIVYWFVTGPMTRLDTFVKNFLPAGDSNVETITRAIPGFGVFIAMVAIVFLGTFAKNFVGRAFIKAGEDLFDSVPVVRNLYRFFKNVFETALQQSERSFKEVALVEYPRPGAWVIAFVVGETKGEVKELLADQGRAEEVGAPDLAPGAPEASGDALTPQPANGPTADPRLTSIFIPTVPNPTSGFLLFVPRSSLRPLAMTVEDAAKAVFSLGLVMPHTPDPEDAVRRLEDAVKAPPPKRSKRKLFGGSERSRKKGATHKE